MLCTVELRGVAIGTLEITANGLTGGTLRPNAGYAAHRALVRDATLATHNFGFLGPADDPASVERASAAFERLRELLDALELRDSDGAIRPCEFLDFTEGPDEESPPFVFLSISDTSTGFGVQI